MLSWFFELLDKFFGFVLAFLPSSPFTPYIEKLRDIPYLGYLNWLIPVGDFLIVGGAWLSAIVIFYAVSAILRWIKVIGD